MKKYIYLALGVALMAAGICLLPSKKCGTRLETEIAVLTAIGVVSLGQILVAAAIISSHNKK